MFGPYAEANVKDRSIRLFLQQDRVGRHVEADRKIVELERFHIQFFFFSEILYLHKIGESTNTLLRRQNHYNTFSLNTGRIIDAKHRGLRYSHGKIINKK